MWIRGNRGLLLAFTLIATIAVVASLAALPVFGGAGSGASGPIALGGGAAADFALPGDVELVKSFDLSAYGLTYERYQQYFGDARAEVSGGQVTVYRDSSGAIALVIGAHYPNTTPSNSIGKSKAAVRGIVDRDIGAAGERTVDLMIDPGTGRYFYRVETRRMDSRWFHWVGAGNGQIMKKYDGIASNDGTGVKGDAKNLTSLTTVHAAAGHGAPGAHWDLFSADNRQLSYDARNTSTTAFFTTDVDNHWNLFTANRQSPGQRALVDEHVYANVTDDYLQARHSLDWIGDCGYFAIESVAHFGINYDNAFWNGQFLVYGDGSGVIFRQLSGGLDVVAHEATHGVTECTSNLIYQNESGALNEGFSDILGSGTEFYADLNGLDPTVLPDWFIGEDVYVPVDTEPGFRNMKDPAEDGDRDHYTELFTGPEDNGGVHTNSGIPNHAYYLLVNGGSNAGEVRGHGHSGPVVTGIGLLDAESIFFLGFTGLAQGASMADARAATEAAAAALFPGGLAGASQQMLSTTDAWLAVGVGVAPPPPPPPTPTPTPVPPTPTPTPVPPTPTPTPTTPPPGGGTMHVGDLDGLGLKLSKGNWEAEVTIAVDDNGEGPLANATVSGTFTQNGSPVSVKVCVTNASGVCTVSSGQMPSKKGKDPATYTVDSVTHASFTYDQPSNHDPDGDSDGTSIEVSK